MSNKTILVDQYLPIEKYGCYYRLVEIKDAEFIMSLRTNEKLSRYINETNNKLKDQSDWLKDYKLRERRGVDFYLMCLDSNQVDKLGLIRIYNIEGDTFEIGSWLFSPAAGHQKSVLGDLFCRSMAFEKLGFTKCKIEVRKKNKHVLRYTKSFNPKLVGEDEWNCYFELEYEDFKKQRDKLLTILGYGE